MRPVYKIDDYEPSEVFMEARNIAGRQIDAEFKKNRGHCDESKDYKWIKPEWSYPCFAHLVFGYKNQVFAVLVDIWDGGQSCLSEKERNRFLEATAKNNLLPCLFRVDLQDMKAFAEGWNLTHILAGAQIVPEQIANDENVLMYEWELHNFAIQIARDSIENEKLGKVETFCDVLEINPQIWFQDTQGNRCWVVVRRVATPEEAEISHWVGFENRSPQLKGFDGYFAGISLASASAVLHDKEGEIIPLSQRFSGKSPLYRGDSFTVNFRGLQRIYVC